MNRHRSTNQTVEMNKIIIYQLNFRLKTKQKKFTILIVYKFIKCFKKSNKKGVGTLFNSKLDQFLNSIIGLLSLYHM